MAEWRALGYVPDSDEEDDTQPSFPCEGLGLQEGFRDIDEFGQDDEQEGEPKEHFGGPEGTADGRKEVEGRNSVEHHKDEGKGHFKSASEENKPAQSAVLVVQDEELPDGTRPIPECDDLDEIQEGHYIATPIRRPGTEWLLAVEVEKIPRLRTPPPPKLTRLLESIASSPLTELSSLTPTAPSLAVIRDAQLSQGENLAGPGSIPSFNLFSSMDADPARKNTRNLRHRNPIQLHPYVIESEKYRQILKARGIKPLRIAQMQESLESQMKEGSQLVESDVDEDSQFQSNDMDSESPINLSPLCFHEPQNPSPPSQSESANIEEDFPDVRELLQHGPSHVAVGGTKRRKVAHTFSKKELRPSEKRQRPLALETPPLSATGIVDVFTSPLLPGTLTPREQSPRADRGFRVPFGASTAALPTPVTSSEPRVRSSVRPHQNAIMVESSAESAGENEDPIVSADDSSENETGHQLERVQRKMRGVLPASWLKLDLKTQKKKPGRGISTLQSLSPGKHIAQRGVARHVVMPQDRIRKTNIRREAPIIVSDDEDSDSSHNTFTRTAFLDEYLPKAHEYNNNCNNDHQIFEDNRGEVLEDNRVDEMLPSTRRQNRQPKKRRKQQLQLPPGERIKPRSTAPGHFSPSRVKFPYQPRITDHLRMGQTAKPKFRPPKLSILDAPTQTNTTYKPRFLKIASRTTRSRLDKGRHSPTHKYIRLPTREDTYDARETLQNWREGIILPAKTPSNGFATIKNSNRQPLHPRSGNGDPRSSTRAGLGFREGDSLGVKSLKRNTPSTKNLKSQSLLDDILPRLSTKSQQTELITTHVGRVKQRHLAKLKGHIVTSLRNSNDSRPANLESLQEDDDRSRPRVAFQKHVLKADRAINTPGNSTVLLERFLNEDPQPLLGASSTDSELRQSNEKHSNRNPYERIAVPFRSRKHPPRRLHMVNFGFRQSSPSIDRNSPTDLHFSHEQNTDGILHGLGSFGTRYTHTFDINPLPAGTYLHSCTFVGGGGLQKSLHLDKHDKMDIPRGFAFVHIHQEVFKWGPWNDMVATQLGTVFDVISEQPRLLLQGTATVDFQQISTLIKDVVNYFSNHLSFLDPIDRVFFLTRCRVLLTAFLSETDAHPTPANEKHQDFYLHILTLLLVMAGQLRQISLHELALQIPTAEIGSVLLGIAQRTLRLALVERFKSLPGCIENIKHLEACEYGIREDCSSIEALVTAHYVLRESSDSLAVFWEIVQNTIISGTPKNALQVHTLELSWQKIFTVLPFLGFDAQGLLESGQRFKVSNDGWSSVKLLTSRVLELQTADPGHHGATFNAYCRTLFGRCLHLVNVWGWYRCEAIIGIMFDFFARNDLCHLTNEESHGSPRFLDHLDETPDLKAASEDRCFHIFLKIIGSGLIHLSKRISEKKIRDIVWRLMPNHGRLHPKEETLRQRDLDALRNHHDLLCTLYWASPPAVRPRLGAIRNLVHLESSHREACHINIRAWANLVRFQLSTDEAAVVLKPFADWHNDLLVQIIRQHGFARTEAEEHVKSSEIYGTIISKETLETTIARNQRQVVAVLGDALISLKIAIDLAKDLAHATVLITPALIPVFDMFNAKDFHANKSVVLALDVVQAYANKAMDEENLSNCRNINDDSQDYGDWSAFDEDLERKDEELASVPQDLGATHLYSLFLEPLKQLLSNSFGADISPEDSLLVKIVQVWVALAHLLVRNGTRSWSDYISHFGVDTWGSLRRTEQTQKFTNYFLSVLIESCEDIYQEHKEFFLASWVDSLVERESMIKFQHRLTTAILNVSSGDPLLKNLPFWTNSETGKFEITASDFLGRRLSLISSLLSNMRESLEDFHQDMSSSLLDLRQDYVALVKHLMNAMKRNYQELGHGSNVRGTYVEFVQRVVEFLQQNTTDICPVDRFFTDSTAFPLPATDPTYVVGRLKNYGLRLHDSRTPKQLAVFLQSVSERAAVDGQQVYLVDQLHAAMSDVPKCGDAGKPTLQSFLIHAIVPAYIEVAFSTSSGWLLASPMLQAIRNVFRNLLASLDGASADSIARVLSIMTAFLDAARKSIHLLIDHSGLLEQPYILYLLGLLYSDITALLPTLDYIVRLTETESQAVHHIGFFTSFAVFATELLLHRGDVHSPDIGSIDDLYEEQIPTEILPYADARDFALRELRDSLGKHWIRRDERYYVVRGNSRREVLAAGGFSSLQEETDRALGDFGAFHACVRDMPTFCKEVGVGMRPLRRHEQFVSEELIF